MDETTLQTPEETPQAIPPNPPPSNSGQDPNSETAYATMLKEREARKQAEKEYKALQKQLEAFKGIDPSEYQKAMEAYQKQAEFERKQAEMQAELEAKIQQKYEPQIEQYRQQLAQTQQQFTDYQRDRVLESAFYDAGGFPGEFEPAALALRGRVVLEDGKVVVLEPDGKTPAYVADKGQSRPKSVKELIADLMAEHIWFARHFKSSERPGFGQSSPGVQVGADADPNQIADALTRYRKQKFG
jgi:hypothetical protein